MKRLFQKMIAIMLATLLIFSMSNSIIFATSSLSAPICTLGTSPDDMLAAGGRRVRAGDRQLYIDEVDGSVYALEKPRELVLNGLVAKLNYADGTLYYAREREEGCFDLCSFDMETGTEVVLLTGFSGQLGQLWLVDNTYLDFSCGNAVWQFKLATGTYQQICYIDQLWSFVPTGCGLVYAVGNLFDYDLYAGGHLLAEHVSNYTVRFDLADGVVVFDSDGVELQADLADAFAGTAVPVVYKGMEYDHTALSSEKEMNSEETMLAEEDVREQAQDEYDEYMTWTDETSVHFDLPEADISDPQEPADMVPSNFDKPVDTAKHNSSAGPSEAPIEEARARQVPTPVFVDGLVRAPITEGQTNIVKRARQMLNIKWTPVAGVGGWGYTDSSYTLYGQIYYYAGTTYTGLPYGQAMSYVPWNTSLSSFAAAVQNPNSKMYTDRCTYSRGSQYYGTDCSGFASWAWQTGTRKTCATMISWSHTYAVGNSYTLLEVGDALIGSSHAILVTDVTYNSDGSIYSIETSEANPTSTYNGCCYSKRFTGQTALEAFNSSYFSRYTIYRSDARDTVTYTHDCAVPLEGDVCEICGAGMEPQPDPEAHAIRGVDLSTWNGDVDWMALSTQIDFAILRVGYTGNGSSFALAKDARFDANAAGCEAYNIPYGIYWYAGAKTQDQAIQEAEAVIEYLGLLSGSGHIPSLPVFYDVEETNNILKLTDTELRTVITAFCSTIENFGLKAGVYASRSIWASRMTNNSTYGQWARWVAQWESDSMTAPAGGHVWQYACNGQVPGISGNVDMNYWLGDVGNTDHPCTALVTEPSCTNAGSLVCTCVTCGDVREWVFPALGHIGGEWTTITEPSCTEAGIKTRVCTRCGETEVCETPALGHSFENGVCTRCGYLYIEIDTTALEAAIAEVRSLDLSIYTAETAIAVIDAIGAAQEVIANPEKTQSMVNEALSVLLAALDGLKTYEEMPGVYALTTEINDGDSAVIFHPGLQRAIMNQTFHDWYLYTAEVTIEDNIVIDPVDDIIWTVHKDTDGFYSFSNGENKIVMWPSGTYAEVTNNAAHEGADPLWNLTLVDGETDLYYISSKTVAHETRGLGYLEVYNKNVDGVSAPYVIGWFSNSPAANDYGFKFFARNDNIEDEYWETPTYVWSEDNSTVTATRYSKTDASYYETETAQTTVVSLTPSCLEPGKTFYYATFENPGFDAQLKILVSQDALGHNMVSIPAVAPSCTQIGLTEGWTCTRCDYTIPQEPVDALGHDWDEPSYVWSEDNSEVSASRICLRDGTHIETETVQTTAEVTTPATCVEPGQTTYTADFEDPVFNQQVKIVADLPALGHDLVTTPSIEPTCTQTGLTEGYFCNRCDYVIPQETIDALGHDYLNGVCTRCGVADPFYADALIEISLLSLYVKPDQPAVIPVAITGGADIAGFTLTVSADPGLTLMRVQKGELLQNADGSLVSNLAKGIVNWTGTEEIAADGELLLLTFTVEETVAINERLGIRLRLKDDKPTNMADAEGAAVSVRFVDGVLIVTPVLFGDTNSDEDVNSADAVRLVRSIVELEELSDIEFLAADVSHDGDVTSSDSIILTRYLAGLVERLDIVPGGTRRVCQAEEAAFVQIETVTGNSGDTVTIPVTISGNTGFAGFTWEITCSESLEITRISKGSLLTQSDGGSLTVNLEKGLVNWNDCYNLEGDGTVLLLTIHIKEDAEPGAYAISLSQRNGSAGNFVDEHGSPVSANYQAGGVMVGCPFEDVQAGAYYLDAVLWAYSHEPQITSGTSETTFSPNQFCTRGQIVTFLWHAAGNPVPSIAESPFNDVQNTNAYYYDAILWAYENEITNGVSASNFGVNQLCTRAQVVTFLWRLAGSPEPMQTETSFSDVPANAWYADAVCWAVENEITAGTSPTTFSPGKTCTRAEVVTFLYKYYMGE